MYFVEEVGSYPLFSLIFQFFSLGIIIDSFLEKELLPLLEEEGVEVLELTDKGHAGRSLFHIVVDRRDQEISIDDCAFLNRKLQRHLNNHSLLAGDWRLEVTSPGIGYPLSQQWQFRKNAGRLLKITLPDEKEPRELSGRLVNIQEEGIELETAKGREHVAYEDVLSACVLPEIRSFPRENKKR